MTEKHTHDDKLAALQTLVHQRCGLQLDGIARPRLERAINALKATTGLDSNTALLERLRHDEAQFDALVSHLTLPALALATVATGVIARLSRSAMLEVLRQDFIRTARAKGVRERGVIWRHALRAAMVSIIPVLGIQAGFVLSGAVYIEIVFQWPGVGRMLVDAILTRDILLVQGGVVFVAACYVMFNIAVDVAQSLLDPRIKT